MRGLKLKEGKGGGSVRFWHIYLSETHVGKVSVEEVSPSTGYVDIHVATKYRGKGVGSGALRKAARLSGFKKIVAEVRKNNLASVGALKKAGFKESDKTRSGELILVWRGLVKDGGDKGRK